MSMFIFRLKLLLSRLLSLFSRKDDRNDIFIYEQEEKDDK